MADKYYYQSLKQREIKRSSSFFSLLVFYIIPFIIINTCLFIAVTAKPKLDLSVLDTTDHKTVDFTVEKKSLFPVKSITANLDNNPIELSKDANGVYHATINSNGNLEIIAENINGMKAQVYEHIASIDDQPPTISGEEPTNTKKIADRTVTVNFDDEGSGIDFSSLYAIDAAGNNLKPLKVDEQKQSATFAYKTYSLEVHVSDMAGNQTTATFNDNVE